MGLNREYRLKKYVKMGVDIGGGMECWEDSGNELGWGMCMEGSSGVYGGKEEWDENEYKR